MQQNYDVIVIGGGPAGCAAAACAARCRWKVLVVDMSIDVGFLASLGNVSYFPGFPESINGRDLVNKMRKQAELVGASFLTDTARVLAAQALPFKVLTDKEREFLSPAVVIATGAAARTNYLHGEREFMGRGVSHDAIADGPAVARRHAMVVGKSKLSAEEALILARFAEKVHFIVPSSKLDADEKLFKQLQSHRAIEMYFSASLKKINGTDHVNSVTIFSGGQERDVPVAGVFTYVHEYQATTGFLEKSLHIASNGSVKVDEKMQSSVEGIFACGDVLCGRPQAPAIAAAQGLIAGLSVDRYLSARK